jgi:hypothetical protein
VPDDRRRSWLLPLGYRREGSPGGGFVPSSNACRDPTPLAQAIPCSIAHARISRLRCGQKIGRSAGSNVGEYVEPNTLAQTVENRPVFKEMLRRIVEERDVDCVLIY